MKINRKHTEPTQNLELTPPPVTLSIQQRKTALIGLNALGNVKTSPTIRIDLLANELNDLKQMTFFAFNAQGAAELFKGDPLLSAMVVIGTQAFVAEAHQEAFKKFQEKNPDFRKLEVTVIPEELWSELHILISNLTPLLLAAVSKSEETSRAENEVSPQKRMQQVPTSQPKGDFRRSTKLQQAMNHFVTETGKIIKASKERHEREKTEEQLAEKKEILRKEIEKYEEKLSRIKKSTSNEELFSLLKEWTESLPPCPIRLLNAMTMWRELINKCVIKNAVG